MTLDERLRSVFASIFGVDGTRITDDDSPATIAEWDSLSHLNLVFALEEEFGVRFEVEEIPELVSVGAIRERVSRNAHDHQHA